MRINHFAKIRFVDFIKSNVVFVFHYFLFILTFTIGAFAVIFNFSFIDTALVESFVKQFLEFDLWIAFKYCLISNLFVITVLYFLSFYPFGAPIIIFVFATVSYCLGSVFAIICREYGFSGILFNLLALTLPIVINLVEYVLVFSASLSISTNIARLIFSNNCVIELRQRTKDLFVLYLIIVFAISLNSLLLSFLITLLSVIITNWLEYI